MPTPPPTLKTFRGVKNTQHGNQAQLQGKATNMRPYSLGANLLNLASLKQKVKMCSCVCPSDPWLTRTNTAKHLIKRNQDVSKIRNRQLRQTALVRVLQRDMHTRVRNVACLTKSGTEKEGRNGLPYRNIPGELTATEPCVALMSHTSHEKTKQGLNTETETDTPLFRRQR